MRGKSAFFRSAAGNAALAAASLLLVLLALEGGVALFHPQKVLVTSAPNIFFVRYDPLVGWVNKEGASGRYRSAPELPETLVRINALGYRGEPVSVQKPPGVRRVLCIGDSNTFGYGIEEGERFSDLLAARLKDSHQVINLGVFGYGTDQEALLLEREGMRYRPDLVVLGLSAGDLADNTFSVNGGANKPFFRMENGVLSQKNTPVPRSSLAVKSDSARSRTKAWLYRHCHLYRLVLTRLSGTQHFVPDSVAEMGVEEGMQTTAGLIFRMDRLCKERGAKLVVLLIPHGAWLAGAGEGGQVGYFPALEGVLDAAGIPFFDATAVLGSYQRAGRPVFFESDPVHLTPLGNQVVAQALYDGFTRYGFLGP